MNTEGLEKINRTMAKASGLAVANLITLLNDPDTSESARVRSSIAILDYAHKFLALADQQRQIDEMKSVLDDLEVELD